jgi:pteridine reductase
MTLSQSPTLAAAGRETVSMEQRPVALITGGAKRVGRAIALRLASAGFDIAFSYRTSGPAALELVDQLSKDGRPGALAVEADLSDPESASDHIASEIERRFGRLDVLVNNASVYLPGRLQETDVAMMRTVAAVHVQVPLLLCKQFETKLRKSHGHVINMVDLLAERPWPQYLIYCASKAALANLTLGLARELAPEVTVNGIAPGVVRWPDGYPVSEQEQYLKRVPLGRAGTPEDVANLVHFLCTEGSYITGQIIRLDGGRSIT